MSESVQAWLLDMDGTLVDTEEAHFAVHAAVLADRGLALLPDLKRLAVGTNDNVGFYRKLAQAQGQNPSDEELAAWDADKRQRTFEIFPQTGIAQIPGAQHFISALVASDKPWAVVTSTKRELGELVWGLAEFPADPDTFVFYEDTPLNKPHPAPYQRAAELLQVDLAACGIVEDSIPGVRAALSTNAQQVVALTTSVSHDQLHALADDLQIVGSWSAIGDP